MYVKQGTSTKAILQLAYLGGTAVDTYVTLTFSTAAVAISGGGVANVTDHGVEVVGDGWYRIWITTTNNSSGNTTCRLSIGSGETGNTVVTWGGMVNEGGAKPYIPTAAATVTRRCEATAARVAEAILGEHGYTIEADSLLKLDAAIPALVGLYFDRPVTILQAAQSALESAGGYLIDGAAPGTYRVGRFKAPTGTVRKAITEDLILDESDIALELVPIGDDGAGIPAYKLTIGYSPNWFPQDGDALTGSSQADRQKWSAPGLFTDPATDVSVQTKHPEARQEVIETALSVEADAIAEQTRRLLFLKSELTRFKVPLTAAQAVWDSDGATPLAIGDRVTLQMARFGLGSAVDFVVIGTDQRFADDEVVLDLITSSGW